MLLYLSVTNMSVSTVTSEALQLKLRQLLPSQQGFGTDISASDTIIPIIDLTTAAEGSDTPQFLQTALNFGGATAFDVNNGTTTIANTSGFYRVFANCSIRQSSGQDNKAQIVINDGVDDKIMWQLTVDQLNSTLGYTSNVDVNIFLAAGETLKIVSNDTSSFFVGNIRQIADSTGSLVNPVGFTPQ